MAKLIVGVNDLATTHPVFAEQWDYESNNTTPQDITAGSRYNASWILPYNDPITGKHFIFKWQSKINTRTSNNSGCPYLTKPAFAAWPGYNDLATTHPKLAAQWHPTKNGNLTPQDVTAGSHLEPWWYLPYDDPVTGKHFDFEWHSSILDRSSGKNYKYLSYSTTEKLTYSLLKDMNIEFETEKKFDKLGLFRFDFYLPFLNAIIEPDGKQHFRNTYNLSEKAYKKWRKNDRIKNQFCLDHNIAILRIPYIYDAKKDADKIQEMILQFLENRQVPEDILLFYAQHEDNNYSEVANKLNKLNNHKSLS